MKIKITISTMLFISIITNAQTIEKFSIDSGGASSTAGGIEILYTIGEVNVQELSAGNIIVSEGFINPEVVVDIKIDPIAFFQGAYINPVSGEETLMRDNLRVASLIPTTSPYADVLTCDASVFTPTGSDAIVDWVWVELRDENDNTNILASQSALLQRDGNIVSVDGTSSLSFDLTSDNYFVAVSHRNHLGILSANTVALSATTTILDLTTGLAVVNGGANAVVDLGNGIFALYAGDYDGNGQIQNTDLTAVRPLLGQPSAYDNADLDMNTQVQNTDLNNLLNPNKGKGQQFSREQDLKLYAKRKK
ncbi:MAG: hemagglutinin protein [Flavobacteriaceae bacterium]|nr:hemagglutinin protein [Flavobacteriaceae bacterium]